LHIAHCTHEMWAVRCALHVVCRMGPPKEWCHMQLPHGAASAFGGGGGVLWVVDWRVPSQSLLPAAAATASQTAQKPKQQPQQQLVQCATEYQQPQPLVWRVAVAGAGRGTGDRGTNTNTRASRAAASAARRGGGAGVCHVLIALLLPSTSTIIGSIGRSIFRSCGGRAKARGHAAACCLPAPPLSRFPRGA
jgi:hypothetical protein